MPALPLDDAGPYVAGAFVVFFGLVLVYLAIMASKLGRIERELSELNALLDGRERRPEPGAADADTGERVRPVATEEAR